MNGIRTPRVARRAALIATATAALLAACGGGRDAPAPEARPAPAAASGLQGAVALGSPVPGRRGTVDGARVCLDVDGSGGCDAGEPAAFTGADGRFVLAASAASGAVLLAELAPGARVDGDAVAQAQVLAAPAGSALVSPLSTLVVAEMQVGGGTAEAIAAILAERAGGIAPLADFTAAGADGAEAASRLAWLAGRTLLAQRAALAEAVAAGSLDGAAVERESALRLAAALERLARAASADDETARAVAAAIGPDADAVRAGARFAALAAPPTPAVPEPAATLRALRYTDADNWSFRVLEQSAADTTPDGDGNQRYVDVHAQSASPSASLPAGVVRRWSGNAQFERRGDLHWNGSAWVACALTDRYLNGVRDAAGRSSYDFCDGRERGFSVQRGEDISGLDMAFVFAEKIRTFPGGNAGVPYSQWGPSDLSVLAGRRFPTGSFLLLQLNTTTAAAITYLPNAPVSVYPASVAAGGDATVTPSVDCANPSIAVLSTATTLEDLISGGQGRPCVVAPAGSAPDLSLVPNEWWGNTTIALAELAGFNTLPAGTGAYYDTRALLRVAFRGADRALFYNCYRRAGDGSTRNCRSLGLGKYRIDAVGDARVLSFTTLPAAVQRAGFDRVFVERGGVVHFGFRNPVGATVSSLRLNLAATNAVFDALDLPLVRPVTQPGTATGARATTLATAVGAWGDATADEAMLLRAGPDGRFLLAEAKAPDALSREQSGAELGWFDIDPATGRMSTLIEVDSSLSSGFSHPRDADLPVVVEPDRILSGGTPVLTRLRDDLGATPASLVGLWALGSPTDLAVPHLVLYANGRGMVATSEALADTECLFGSAPGECPPGVEFFDWAYDATVSELRLFNLLYDTNGCGGLINGCPTALVFGDGPPEALLSISVAADGSRFDYVDTRDEPVTAFRISPRP